MWNGDAHLPYEDDGPDDLCYSSGMAQNNTTEANMTTITLTEDQIDLLLTSLEARRVQLQQQAWRQGNEDIEGNLLALAGRTHEVEAAVRGQVTEVESFEAQMAREAREAREADEDYAAYLDEYHAEGIASMEAERRSEYYAMRDEALYGRDEF
jgi:ribosomal protein S13